MYWKIKEIEITYENSRENAIEMKIIFSYNGISVRAHFYCLNKTKSIVFEEGTFYKDSFKIHHEINAMRCIESYFSKNILDDQNTTEKEKTLKILKSCKYYDPEKLGLFREEDLKWLLENLYYGA